MTVVTMSPFGMENSASTDSAIAIDFVRLDLVRLINRYQFSKTWGRRRANRFFGFMRLWLKRSLHFMFTAQQTAKLPVTNAGRFHIPLGDIEESRGSFNDLYRDQYLARIEECQGRQCLKAVSIQEEIKDVKAPRALWVLLQKFLKQAFFYKISFFYRKNFQNFLFSENTMKISILLRNFA